jgi:hypothetical protein
VHSSHSTWPQISNDFSGFVKRNHCKSSIRFRGPVPASIRISKTLESWVLWLRNLILSSTHSDLSRHCLLLREGEDPTEYIARSMVIIRCY